MDQQHLLYYILLFIWLLPFTFGKFHTDILNTCLEGIYHKEEPGAESELYHHCTPWRNRSCCTQSISKRLHEPKHYNFNLDHCASVRPISEKCKTHFHKDLCFYECSPNVGPWLVQVDMKVRKERFYQVPLCKEDCVSWFEDCKNDFTCNGNWLRGWKWNASGNSCPENAVCQTFQDIFHNFTNFCEKVWDHSWKVVEDSRPCMKIWFDAHNGNPNDAVAKYYMKLKASEPLSSSDKLTGAISLISLWILVLSYPR